jgi:hypothetical protein
MDSFGAIHEKWLRTFVFIVHRRIAPQVLAFAAAVGRVQSLPYEHDTSSDNDGV